MVMLCVLRRRGGKNVWCVRAVELLVLSGVCQFKAMMMLFFS